jgi:hypothetical protein
LAIEVVADETVASFGRPSRSSCSDVDAGDQVGVMDSRRRIGRPHPADQRVAWPLAIALALQPVKNLAPPTVPFVQLRRALHDGDRNE